jgi:hypothetical protein
MLKAGFYAGLSNQDYHTGQGAFAESKSSLANILDSPRKYKFEKSQPELDVFDKDALKFNDGTAFHTYFNEKEKFDKEIVVYKPFTGDGSRALNKDLKQSIRDKGLIPIKGDIVPMLQDFDALLHSGEHETARKIIENPKRIVEQAGFYQDPRTGLWLKIKPDIILPFDVAIWDLKKHSSIKSFQSQAMYLNYDLQAYMAMQGCSILAGVEHTKFGFIVFHAQEKPYDIEVVNADYDFIESGRRKFVKATALLKECLDNDKWPGKYPDEVGTISPTDWRLRQLETGIYN